MQIRVQPFTIHKQVALTISRGTFSETTNLWLILEQDGVQGWGEAVPFDVGYAAQTTAQVEESLQGLGLVLASYTPWQRQAIEHRVQTQALPSAAWTALDLALHDWMGKALGIPLWQMWGLDRSSIPPLSVTIGISSPEVAQQRLRDWLTKVDAQWIKVKLGSPEGMVADQALVMAVQEVAPTGVGFLVDANGGWDLTTATTMVNWLADRGVAYVEQPLAPGQEAALTVLKTRSPLPIFVDESCRTSADIPVLADRVDGINIKLVKAGGLTEAWRMIHTARAFGLQVMLGCYSESILLNTAAAHLSPLVDYVDLDSHLNLRDDPFQGAIVQAGKLIPNDLPGLGVSRIC